MNTYNMSDERRIALKGKKKEHEKITVFEMEKYYFRKLNHEPALIAASV